MIKKFNESTQAKGLDIKNEYTKLINDDTMRSLDLGYTSDVSETDITNITQTYKDSIIRVIDGHYILFIKENIVLKYTDFQFLNEDGFGSFVDFFKKKEPVTEKTKEVLHQDINGIPEILNITKLKYEQILYAFDKKGYDSLSSEDKKIFDQMVYYANLRVQGDENDYKL